MKIERRAFAADIKVRESPGAVALRGYAALFDSPSHGEVVRRGAFTKTIAEKADVRLLVNHDGVPLARTKSGTMTLGTDEVGMWVDAPSLDPANPTVQELTSAMRRGDIDQMSFAFVDRTDAELRFDDDGTRNIHECELFDASIVTYSWYEDTSAQLKELDTAFMALRNGTATREQRDLFVKLVIFDDDDDDLTTDLESVGEGTGEVPADDNVDETVTPAEADALLSQYAAEWNREVFRALVK